MTCHCTIVPDDVLKRLAQDETLSDRQRKALLDTAAIGAEIRKLRIQAASLTRVTMALAPAAVPAPAPAPAPAAITVADCRHGQTLPGTPIARPGTSGDSAVKNAFDEARAVYEFYQTVFGRNSIDNMGMTIGSSVHYGRLYNNAFWNGSRMAYGDGDGQLFVDFTGSTDVIAHELTHGVTQYSAQLGYSGDAGGLNESLSNCFGSMFRQWRKQQDVSAADWLIGADIMGPQAKAKGFTCLRDMAAPAADHCLAPQPHALRRCHQGHGPALQQRHPQPRVLHRRQGDRRQQLGRHRHNLVPGDDRLRALAANEDDQVCQPHPHPRQEAVQKRCGCAFCR